jgi:hypothetical protein
MSCARPHAIEPIRNRSDGAEKDAFASDEVGQFAVHGHGDGAGQQVRGEHPGVTGDATKLGHDRWHGRGHDRRIEADQEGRRERRQRNQPTVNTGWRYRHGEVWGSERRRNTRLLFV